MSVLPARVLYTTPSTVYPAALWTIDDGSGDPWINQPYRWAVTLHIAGQSHSCHLTPTPFSYTGNDVQVGDWFSDIASGAAVRIVSISAQNANEISCILEDVDRFNTFNDPSQTGLGFSAGPGFIFTLADDGLPVLSPMTALSAGLAQNIAWQTDQISRFRYRNYLRSHYPVQQPGHGFSVGDLICLTPTGYRHAAAASTVSNIAGSVAGIGTPSADWFDFRPVGRIVKNLATALPGQPGDIIYLDATGALTATKPSSFARPVYMRLDAATTAIVLDRNVDVTNSQGFNSQTYVVDTIPDRDALTGVNVGDQVLVKDIGNGSWSHYIYDETGVWMVLVANVSGNSSARTVQVPLTFQSPSTGTLVSIPTGSTITEVIVQVTSAFDGSPSLEIGTLGSTDQFMSEVENDLSALGTYQSEPAALPVSVSPRNVLYSLNAAQSSRGTVIVSITFS